jgi:hypothetical protein
VTRLILSFVVILVASCGARSVDPKEQLTIRLPVGYCDSA